MSFQRTLAITERFAWQPRSVYDLGLSAEELGVFCFCSNMAAHKPLDLNTRAGKLKLSPGQLYTTIRQLAEKLKITKDKIARTLKKLAEMGLIEVLKTATRSATHGSMLTVCHLKRFPPDGFDGETIDATKTRQECDTNKKRETRNKNSEPKGSCGASAPRFGFPDLDEVLSDPVSQAASPEPAPKRSSRAPASKSPDGYSEAFTKAWDATPPMARKRSSRPEAYAEWKKLTEPERTKVVEAIEVWEHNKYAIGFHLWLKRRRWESLIEVVRRPAAASTKRNWAEADA